VYRKETVTGIRVGIDPAILGRLTATSGFRVEDANKYKRSYLWFSAAECRDKRVRMQATTPTGDFSALVYPPIGLEEHELNKYLAESRIDTSQWGTGLYKSLAEFSEELVKGEATLSKHSDGRPIRVVEIVVLKILEQTTGQILVEVEEANKGIALALRRLPAIKRRADEHHFWAARRLISMMMPLSDKYIDLDPASIKVTEEEQESTSYFGLRTLYRKRFMAATLLPSPVDP